MMPIVAQLPALRTYDRVPVLILGFPNTEQALCVMPDGSLEFVAIFDIRVDWTYDNKAELWTSTTSTLEEADESEEEARTDPPVADPI